MKICFKEILLKNFLSYGDNIDNNRITLDTGTMTLFSGKNGAGKCFSRETQIEIKIENKEAEKAFLEYLSHK